MKREHWFDDNLFDDWIKKDDDESFNKLYPSLLKLAYQVVKQFNMSEKLKMSEGDLSKVIVADSLSKLRNFKVSTETPRVSYIYLCFKWTMGHLILKSHRKMRDYRMETHLETQVDDDTDDLSLLNCIDFNEWNQTYNCVSSDDPKFIDMLSRWWDESPLPSIQGRSKNRTKNMMKYLIELSKTGESFKHTRMSLKKQFGIRSEVMTKLCKINQTLYKNYCRTGEVFLS
jgi:hypothetical protein